ncbi:hypothetical protein HDU97_009319 [Phlyctochytrium planicorne]|nr:hypothetical protein HDU97_009319 [Phlyctochytrium planicorne]
MGAIREPSELTARDGDAITSVETVVNQDCAALHSMFPIVEASNCCGRKPQQSDGYYIIECSPDKTRIVNLELEWNPGQGSIEECQLKICPFVSFDAFTTLTELVSAQLHIYTRSFRTTFPKDLGNLKKLEYLNLVLDVTGQLPESLNELVNLKLLYLSGVSNAFEEEEYNPISFPEEIGGLRSLQELTVNSLALSSLPDSIASIPLTDLRLTQNHLSHFPSVITKISTLQRIDLEMNDITDVPEGFYNLVNLERITFMDNKIESIDNIRNLPKVTYLNLGSNNIKRLPAGLATLTNLKSLALFSNSINTITGDFSGLVNLKEFPPNLQEIDVGYNDFEAVPQVFKNLSSLKSLDISRNFIKLMPDAQDIPQNAKLQLSSNCISGSVNASSPNFEGLNEKRSRQECDEHVIPVEPPPPETSLSISSLSQTVVVSTTASPFDTTITLLTTSEAARSGLLPALSITGDGQKANFVTTGAAQLETPKTLQDHETVTATVTDRGNNDQGAIPSITPNSGPKSKNDESDSRSVLPSVGVIAGVSFAAVVFVIAVAVVAMWINKWRRREFRRRMLEPALAPIPSPLSDLETNQVQATSGVPAEHRLSLQEEGRASGEGRLFNDDLTGKRGEAGLFDGVRAVDGEYEVKQREEYQMPGEATLAVAKPAGTGKTSMKSVLDWSVDDVFAWVNSIGFREDVADTFRRHQINGQRLLGLTDRILENELGFTEKRLRSSILTIRYKTFMEGRNLAEHFYPNRPDTDDQNSS